MKREREHARSHGDRGTAKTLALQLDLDDFEWRFAGTFRQVRKGVHVLHRPGVRVDVLTPSVRVSELGVCDRQEHCNRFRVAVHHGFFARAVLDPNHSESIIFELDLVMLGINFRGVFGGWLRRSCGCHIPSFNLKDAH